MCRYVNIFTVVGFLLNKIRFSLLYDLNIKKDICMYKILCIYELAYIYHEFDIRIHHFRYIRSFQSVAQIPYKVSLIVIILFTLSLTE